MWDTRNLSQETTGNNLYTRVAFRMFFISHGLLCCDKLRVSCEDTRMLDLSETLRGTCKSTIFKISLSPHIRSTATLQRHHIKIRVPNIGIQKMTMPSKQTHTPRLWTYLIDSPNALFVVFEGFNVCSDILKLYSGAFFLKIMSKSLHNSDILVEKSDYAQPCRRKFRGFVGFLLKWGREHMIRNTWIMYRRSGMHKLQVT